MAGIYIHIPFCKQRCTYCDFYTEIAPQFVDEFISSIKKELLHRKNYITGSVSTIYFGGGTPSILNYNQLNEILNLIYSEFNVEKDAEITIESNPDDLTETYLSHLKELKFNRLSIGIQSFDDNDLKRLNRRHNSIQACEAAKNAKQIGFDNISIDLIYGLPFQHIESWEKQLKKAFELGIQHISAYGLTYEEGTKLWIQRNEGLVTEIDEDKMNNMYSLMLKLMKHNNFEAYEISNFCKPGFRSRHNSSYWKFEPFLGLGPSAHSYDGVSRQWNIASIKLYINALKTNADYFSKEILTINDQYNDYIMVSFRTTDGVDLKRIENLFGELYKSYFIKNIKQFLITNHVDLLNNKYKLTEKGIFISNLIIRELMKV